MGDDGIGLMVDDAMDSDDFGHLGAGEEVVGNPVLAKVLPFHPQGHQDRYFNNGFGCLVSSRLSRNETLMYQGC